MNKFRCSAASCVCNGFIYVIGGHDGRSIFKSVEKYNPLSDSWEMCGDLNFPRSRLGATSLNGKYNWQIKT
jgi:kelch-like protein 2/3